MLARSVKDIPEPADFDDPDHPGLLYEPKWDGFRCVVTRDGDDLVLASRNGKPLNRYFPELVEAFLAQLPERCVLDGEVIVVRGDRLDFEALQERIHPAKSRVDLLREQTPASYVAFDLMGLDGEDLTREPLAVRRLRLEAVLEHAAPPLHLTPVTTDAAVALRWFEQFEGAGLDGVMAKPLNGTYQPGARSMFKVKHARTADVVVAGYREHKNSTPERPLVGSLLLALYDDEDNLRHIGVAASFTEKRRAELFELMQERLAVGDESHPWARWAEMTASGSKAPQPGSRWNAGKDLSFVPVTPDLVCEVGYDHMEGERFRHTGQFKRWRTDRDPESCRYDQLEEVVAYDLADILGREPRGASEGH